MQIYIASSWKNQHSVEMLTALLRKDGHQVHSFVEKAVSDEGRTNIKFDFEQWIYSQDGLEKFVYDTNNAVGADLVVYVGPSGTDAWAEVGAAWGSGVRILGLWAKSEPAGLMRHMIEWFTDYKDLLVAVNENNNSFKADSKATA